MSQGEKKPIGRILLQQRALTPTELEEALGNPSPGGRLASRLAAAGTISEIDALKALSEQHGIPGIDLRQLCLRLDDLDVLPREIAERRLILPVLVRDERVFIAMANPRDQGAIDELEFLTGKKVYAYVALEATLRVVISSAYDRLAQGAAYFVGPACPAAVLAKAGLSAAGDPLPRSGSPEPAGCATHLAASDGLAAPALVVEDAGGPFSGDGKVEDEGFGDVSPELSVVAELPDQPPEAGTIPDARLILVVDDEDDIRRMLMRLLSARGYRVLEADRGLAALRIVKEHTPDLIVLDAMLPEVHGFDLAKRIKGSARYGHIPIIMVSAVYRGWRYAEDLKASYGVDHYLEKPFKIADVVAAVEECLQTGTHTDRQKAQGVSAEAEAALKAGVSAYMAGHTEEAITQLQRGIGIDPLAYRLHFHLGLLYGKLNRVYEAMGQLETALEINGRHFPAIKNLAILYQKAGFRNKAAETWQRALSLAPDEATRHSIRQHLIQLL